VSDRPAPRRVRPPSRPGTAGYTPEEVAAIERMITMREAWAAAEHERDAAFLGDDESGPAS
jgi:hypothetical protein